MSAGGSMLLARRKVSVAQFRADLKACVKAWGSEGKLAAELETTAGSVRTMAAGYDKPPAFVVKWLYGPSGGALVARGPDGKAVERRWVEGAEAQAGAPPEPQLYQRAVPAERAEQESKTAGSGEEAAACAAASRRPTAAEPGMDAAEAAAGQGAGEAPEAPAPELLTGKALPDSEYEQRPADHPSGGAVQAGVPTPSPGAPADPLAVERPRCGLPDDQLVKILRGTQALVRLALTAADRDRDRLIREQQDLQAWSLELERRAAALETAIETFEGAPA